MGNIYFFSEKWDGRKKGAPSLKYVFEEIEAQERESGEALQERNEREKFARWEFLTWKIGYLKSQRLGQKIMGAITIPTIAVLGYLTANSISNAQNFRVGAVTTVLPLIVSLYSLYNIKRFGNKIKETEEKLSGLYDKENYEA
jgi:hypothetical protein